MKFFLLEDYLHGKIEYCTEKAPNKCLLNEIIGSISF